MNKLQYSLTAKISFFPALFERVHDVELCVHSTGRSTDRGTCGTEHLAFLLAFN